MPKVPLQGMTLAMLSDGYAGKAIDAGLREIERDLMERGQDGQKRTLTIKVTFDPDEKGRVDIDTQVGVKTPAFRPPKTQAKLDQRAGGLMFNPDCSENPDQTTFADLDDK